MKVIPLVLMGAALLMADSVTGSDIANVTFDLNQRECQVQYPKIQGGNMVSGYKSSANDKKNDMKYGDIIRNQGWESLFFFF